MQTLWCVKAGNISQKSEQSLSFIAAVPGRHRRGIPCQTATAAGPCWSPTQPLKYGGGQGVINLATDQVPARLCPPPGWIAECAVRPKTTWLGVWRGWGGLSLSAVGKHHSHLQGALHALDGWILDHSECLIIGPALNIINALQTSNKQSTFSSSK